MQTTNSAPSDSRFLKSDQVMTMLGYADRSSFWQSVKRSGIPYIRVNARRCLFDQRQLSAWLLRRSMGTPDRDLRDAP